MHWQERQKAKERHGICLQFPLRVAVRMWPEGPGSAYPRETWPTPTKSDGMGGPGQAASCQGGMNLRTAVSRFPPPLNVVVGGNMNPAWVEWLMGWPLGWTDLHVSAMDRFRQWCDSHGIDSHGVDSQDEMSR